MVGGPTGRHLCRLFPSEGVPPPPGDALPQASRGEGRGLVPPAVRDSFLGPHPMTVLRCLPGTPGPVACAGPRPLRGHCERALGGAGRACHRLPVLGTPVRSLGHGRGAAARNSLEPPPPSQAPSQAGWGCGGGPAGRRVPGRHHHAAGGVGWGRLVLESQEQVKLLGD